MGIYLDVSAAVHGRAGLGRYAESLVRALVAMGRDDLTVFYNHAGQSPRTLPGLEFLPQRRIAAGYKPWRLAVWLGHKTGLGFDRLVPGAQLFHATEHLLPPLHNVPSVFTVHDLIFHLFPQHHKRLNLWYLNTTMPMFCRKADAIIAVSCATRNDLIAHYGVSPEKISVIYEAAAPHFVPASEAEMERVRRRYGLPDHYAMALGTIEPRKNLIRVIEALAKLRDAGHTIPLVMVGSKGWLYDDFFRRLEELKLGDQVLWPGYVPDGDLPAVLSGAAVLVEASLYEGFGLPVLEAMACGTPVICSDSASLPEVAGPAARYVNPSDVTAIAEELKTVWSNRDLQKGMRTAGILQAARFSWERTATETLALYTRLVPELAR